MEMINMEMVNITFVDNNECELCTYKTARFLAFELLKYLNDSYFRERLTKVRVTKDDLVYDFLDPCLKSTSDEIIIYLNKLDKLDNDFVKLNPKRHALVLIKALLTGIRNTYKNKKLQYSNSNNNKSISLFAVDNKLNRTWIARFTNFKIKAFIAYLMRVYKLDKNSAYDFYKKAIKDKELDINFDNVLGKEKRDFLIKLYNLSKFDDYKLYHLLMEDFENEYRKKYSKL